MKDRTDTGLVATIVVVLITLFLVGAGAIAEAEAGYGEIRTTDYGTTPTSGGAYFWRGYSFKLTQETTVTHIIGGGVKEGDQFAGAIFDANLDGSDNPTSPKSILREVTFAGDTANQVVAIANLTLQADTWYYIAQGSLSSNDYLHWYVESLDAPDLVAASFRVSHWMPDTAAPGQAHYWTAGDPGEVVVDTPPNTTPDKPALGFRYLSDATLPEVETTDDPMYGRLLDRGNAPTALYIEYGTDSALEDGTTLNLAHPGYEGDVPHVYGTTASGLDPSTTYYYRARAINDAGRVDGDIKSFTTPDPPGAPTITGIVPGNEQLSVSIEPPAEGGVGNYDYSVDGGSTWTARSPASSASPLVIPGLTNGTTYQVRVRAVDQGIVGTASDVVEGTPEELQFTLTYTAGSNGSIEGETHQVVSPDGDGTEVIAVPNSGYRFRDWSDGVSTAARTDVEIDEDIAVEARFARRTPIYSVRVTIEPTDGGIVHGSGTFRKDATVRLEAVPATDYEFSGWYERGDRIGSDATLTFEAQSNRRFEAQFTESVDEDPEEEPDEEAPDADAVEAEARRSAYIVGYPDGSFRPESNLTRAHTAVILGRLHGPTILADPDGVECEDLDPDDAMFDAMAKAVAGGLMSGYDDGTMKPDEPITRAEMAVLVVRWLGREDVAPHPFTDLSGHWAADFATRAWISGIMVGHDDGTFRPDQPVTRAEAVTIINRLIGRDGPEKPGEVFWTDVPPDHWAYGAIGNASRHLGE